MTHLVYLIASDTTNRTYIGYTTSMKKRLRQHNGELVGGAKATKYGRPWRVVCWIEGFTDKKTALKFEWRCHHPFKKYKMRPTYRRFYNFYDIFQKGRTSSKGPLLDDLSLKMVFLEKEWLEYWMSLKPEFKCIDCGVGTF